MFEFPRVHPWSRPALPARPRALHTVAFARAVVGALATATSSEVAAAYGLGRGTVSGMAHRSAALGHLVARKPRDRPSLPVVVADVPRYEPTARPAPVTAPRVPTSAVADARYGTGVTILDVVRGQCRALDDHGDCCAQPSWRGGSWCVDHRRAYVCEAA